MPDRQNWWFGALTLAPDCVKLSARFQRNGTHGRITQGRPLVPASLSAASLRPGLWYLATVDRCQCAVQLDVDAVAVRMD
jgi:hypothetical protein